MTVFCDKEDTNTWERGGKTPPIIKPVLLHTMPSDNILVTILIMLTFLLIHNISVAINTFAPYKNPGVDGIFPALLQEGQRVLVPYLVRFSHACLVTGYVPAVWHQVKVVFLPKPGRNYYCGPKDLRPINLTSFLLKTTERLVDRLLRDEFLVLRPLHPNQHAYQAGKSVETAHQLVVWVEKALDRQEIA
jgi:hypothetical protein